MGDTLICPHCRMKLWYAQASAPMLTCPRCLSVFPNPNPTPTPTQPLQVLPLEDESGTDIRETTRTLIVIAVVLCAAGVLAAVVGQGQWLGTGLFFAGIAVAIATAFTHRKSTDRRAAIAEPPQSSTGDAAGGAVLDYAHHRRHRPEISVSPAAFIAGFFSAIGVGFICFMALGAGTSAKTVPARLLIFFIVIALLIALIIGANRLGRVPRWNGFGRGVGIGLILAMMALGPCGACYLMFLFE